MRRGCGQSFFSERCVHATCLDINALLNGMPTNNVTTP